MVGGLDTEGFDAASVELWNPATGTWTTNGSSFRINHTATVLADGRVLIVGGYDPELDLYQKGALIYDAATGQFTSGGTMAEARASHVATLLPDGKVLVAGGSNDSGTLPPQKSMNRQPECGFRPVISRWQQLVLAPPCSRTAKC